MIIIKNIIIKGKELKKIISVLSLSAITAISSFAGLTQTNINGINKLVEFSETNNSKFETYNELLNYINMKNLDLGIKQNYFFNEMYFDTKTNTLFKSTTIKEKILINEYRNNQYSFDKSTWPEYFIFDEKNRESLRDTLLFYNCKDFNVFDETNFLDTFVGSFNGKFTINYKINQKTCDEVNKKVFEFERKIDSLKQSKYKENIRVEIIGLFVIEHNNIKNPNFISNIYSASNIYNQNTNVSTSTNNNDIYMKKARLSKDIDSLQKQYQIFDKQLIELKTVYDQKIKLQQKSLSKNNELNSQITSLKIQYNETLTNKNKVGAELSKLLEQLKLLSK